MLLLNGIPTMQCEFQVECLGLLIACLGHDLDHRGTTNSFQIKAKNSLATLYASSTMERHHLNQCLLLLNIPGNRILENMSEVAIKEVVKPAQFISNKL